MCLSRVFTDEEMEEWLADKPEVIEVEKWVTVSSGYGSFYDTCSFACRYESGLNQARCERPKETGGGKYWPYFHFWVKPPSWIESSTQRIIKCIVKKEWITAIGEDGLRLSIVASQAVFPHYPETEARLEDVPQEEVAVESKT